MKKESFLDLLPLAIFISPLLFACNNADPKRAPQSSAQAAPSPRDCINKVFAADDSLGKLRNHACETIPLAETIRNYTDALQRLDFSSCPPAFTAAFEKHRQAWLRLVPFVERYPDLRGEMHDLFEIFEKGEEAGTFKPLLKDVWDTWAGIEAAMENSVD